MSQTHTQPACVGTEVKNTTPPIPNWQSTLKPEILPEELTASICESLHGSFDDDLEIIVERFTLTEEPSKDPYDSAEFLANIAWGDIKHQDDFHYHQALIAFAALSGASSIAPSSEQAEEFLVDAQSQCFDPGLIDQLVSYSSDLDFRLLTMRDNARNLPWYPKGFVSYDSNTAYRFLEYGKDYRCTYSSAYCWGVEMLTKLGCSSLYAEMTILDSSGRNIGFTNDSANGVRPNEKVILIFNSFEDGADQGRLELISCY
jgi:hypothetical protein